MKREREERLWRDVERNVDRVEKGKGREERGQMET